MSKSRHSYIRFFPSDWLGGTARMQRLHKSVYFDVCMYTWDTGNPCPASELPLMLGDLPNWRELVDDLIAAGKLVRSPDGSLANKRAMDEAKHAFDLWERKSVGGRKGAAKTNNSGTGDGTPDSTPVGTGDGIGPGLPTQNQNQNQNQNQIEDNNQPLCTDSREPETQPPDDRSVARLVDIDFVEGQARVLAGMAEVDAGSKVQLRLWIGDGIGEQTILETIRAVMANTDDHTSSFRRFDKPIRKAHAKLLAGPANGNGNSSRYVSESGHVYRGTPEAVMREAERRADWGTYYQAQRDMEARA